MITNRSASVTFSESWITERRQPVMADKVISVLNEINDRCGKGVLRLASVPASPNWARRSELMS